jgi:tetratricopeptide (TPR) repeat protein
MKTKFSYSAVMVLLLALGAASTASAQTARAMGVVTDNGTPVPNVKVIYKSTTTGRQVIAKTNSKGEFLAIGVPVDHYNVTVVDSSGKTLYSHNNLVIGQSGDSDENILNIDFVKGVTAKTPGGASVGTGLASRTNEFAGDEASAGPKAGKTAEGSAVSKEEYEAAKAQRAKAENINGLIKQYQAAKEAKDWKAAIPPLQAMTAADNTRWEYFSELGNMQFNVGQYEDAIQSYDQGVKIAEGYVSGTTPKDPKYPNSDPAKAKTGMAQMLTMKGSAYVKLSKNPEAVAAYTKAAELDPNPGIAYFNLCATQYNTGNTEGALAACDKAIAADPNKADAYFIKGSLLMASSAADKEGKITAPPGTAEALNKYLQLAPDGAHANDVKQMLAYIGSKVETTYKSTKKK